MNKIEEQEIEVKMFHQEIQSVEKPVAFERQIFELLPLVQRIYEHLPLPSVLAQPS